MPSPSVKSSVSSFLGRELPLTLIPPSLRASGWLAFAVWAVAALFGPALLGSWGIALNPHGHAALLAHGHPFVDARGWLGIPNACDVLSNVALLMAGIWGLVTLARSAHAPFPVNTHQALLVFFWGLVATSVGSSIYHWAPDAKGLVFDRLGMAITFAGALSLAMAESVGALAARTTLLAMLVLGCLSAVMPLTHGNVLPWAVVQFGGIAFIAWATLRKPLPTALGVSLGGLLALYALAKAFELGDAAVFQATGELVSGHSFKHLIAALAAWPVIHAMRQNAPSHPKMAATVPAVAR